MTSPSPVVLCFLVAGALDLIFALGLYLFAIRFREKAASKSLPRSMVPTPVIGAILALLGVLTLLAGVLQWIFKPI